jgi:hypothetical protein
LVALREIRFFRRDPAGYLLTIIVPLIAFAVLTWTFSSTVVRGLDVVVVDADRSAVSANLAQSIAVAPGVAERAEDLKGAPGRSAPGGRSPRSISRRVSRRICWRSADLKSSRSTTPSILRREILHPRFERCDLRRRL